jgi:uncharacterized protein (TIGR00369 family)
VPAEKPQLGPFADFIGAALDEEREGYARLSLTLEDKHMNPHGVVHGGVLTTLMDEACAHAVAAAGALKDGGTHASIEMNVSFLSGARVGDRLVFEGRTLRVGRTVAFAEAEVRRNEDTLMAKGRLTFVIQAKRDA